MTLGRELPAAEALGPATLAYLDPPAFQPPAGDRAVPADHEEMRTLLAAVSPADADESGLAEITSSAYVVRDGAAVVAAAGLLPQWRARPEASRRVGQSLSFCDLGWQLSVRLG